MFSRSYSSREFADLADTCDNWGLNSRGKMVLPELRTKCLEIMGKFSFAR